jgi:excisionase family DNA binding protein
MYIKQKIIDNSQLKYYNTFKVTKRKDMINYMRNSTIENDVDIVNTASRVVYTVADIQKLLGIGRKQAYQLCNNDRFPTIHVGKKILIPIKLFDTWLENAG